MAKNGKNLQTENIEKQEVMLDNGIERTRSTKAYVPRTDIFETDNAIWVIADMPGVDEKSVDVVLEKNTLSIQGYVNNVQPDNYNLAYAEYEIGDFQRSFSLSNEVDQSKIEATVKDGVLRLCLPKVEMAKTRKIAVKAA